MSWIKPLDEFKKILSSGLIPLLPHPERYFYLSESELMSFIEAGVQIQSNYGSLAGLYGSEAQENARKLIAGGLVSHFGTDMHNEHYIRVIGKWFAEGNPIEEYPTSI
jgi:tyrosine-protein phosphatase YwqE